jgi:hypothetical protein
MQKKKGVRGAGRALTCGDLRFQISDFKHAGGWRRFEIKDGGFQISNVRQRMTRDSRFQTRRRLAPI